MKVNYNFLRNIFIQSSLTDSMLDNKIKSLGKDFMFTGELRYWFWRYVFMKNITAKSLTNNLLKSGFDNLTTIEIINALNSTREIVKELLDDAKEQVK